MKRFIIIVTTLLLVFVYGILVPIVPFTSYIVSNQDIVRLYPSNNYLMNDDADFEGYMNNDGWSLSHVDLSTWFYTNGEKTIQLHTSNFYRVYEFGGKVIAWNDSAKIINYPKIVVTLMIVIYYMVFVGWLYYVYRYLRKCNQ